MIFTHMMITGYKKIKNKKSHKEVLNFGHESEFYYSVMIFPRSKKFWQLGQILHYINNSAYHTRGLWCSILLYPQHECRCLY